MKVCHFCKEEISDKEQICAYCGYNFQTDTVIPDFVKKIKEKDKGEKQKLIGSGIKTFIFWATLIIIFSLIFKYHGKIGNLIQQGKSYFKKVKKSQIDKAAEFIDLSSVRVPVKKSKAAGEEIEGIFYDPKAKSYVIINGKLVSEGESFEGVFIKKVNNDSVEIIKDGKTKILLVDTNNNP